MNLWFIAPYYNAFITLLTYILRTGLSCFSLYIYSLQTRSSFICIFQTKSSFIGALLKTITFLWDSLYKKTPDHKTMIPIIKPFPLFCALGTNLTNHIHLFSFFQNEKYWFTVTMVHHCQHLQSLLYCGHWKLHDL